jgi:hypothetical protein
MLERSEKEVRGWVRARPIGVKLVEHGWLQGQGPPGSTYPKGCKAPFLGLP